MQKDRTDDDKNAKGGSYGYYTRVEKGCGRGAALRPQKETIKYCFQNKGSISVHFLNVFTEMIIVT